MYTGSLGVLANSGTARGRTLPVLESGGCLECAGPDSPVVKLASRYSQDGKWQN